MFGNWPPRGYTDFHVCFKYPQSSISHYSFPTPAVSMPWRIMIEGFFYYPWPWHYSYPLIAKWFQNLKETLWFALSQPKVSLRMLIRNNPRNIRRYDTWLLDPNDNNMSGIRLWHNIACLSEYILPGPLLNWASTSFIWGRPTQRG